MPAPNAQARPDFTTVPLAAADGGRVAAGGPVAALQRSIEDRMAAGDLLPEPQVSAFDRAAVLVSRLAGLVALGAGYAAVTWWWVG